MQTKNGKMVLLRVFCLLCALTMAAGLLTACGKGKGNEKKTTEERTGANGTTGTEAVETDEWGQKTYDDVVPKDLDYEGTTVNILMRQLDASDPRRYEWFVDSIESADDLSEAIWFRNQEIEEELGVRLKFTQKPDSEINTAISTAALGGGDGVDLISHYHYYATSTETMNYYKNVMHPDFTYLHLSNPYWNQNFIRYATTQGTEANDRLFVLQGDMNLSTFMTTFCMYFQKNLLQNRCNMSDSELYKLTLDGKWTIDKLISLVRDTATLQDGTKDAEGNIYGFTSHYQVHAYDGFLAAFDIDLTQVSDKGKHTLLNSTAQRKLQQAADKLVTFYRSNDAYLVGNNPNDVTYGGSYTTPVAAFRQSRSVFCVAGMGDYKHLSEMPQDSWGLLPLPKYEESQTAYYAGVQDSHNTVAVMYGSNKNYEMLSAVLELFASKSYATVRPQLFNRVIKGQKLQDAQSSRVFDLIMNSTRWDFSDIYPTAVKDVRNTLWRDALRGAVYGSGDGAAAVISALSKNKDTMNDALETLDGWLYSHYN